MKGELFKGFKGRLFGERPLAVGTCDEIYRLADGHRDAKIEGDAPLVTGGAGNLLQSIGHVRLCAQIKFHIRVDRKTVVAFLADTTPLAVWLHKTPVDAEARFFADRASNGGETLFDFFWGL